MSVDYKMVIAGFGGQGILFAGKFIAYTGLFADLQISWLPSYGPEMRGGTANCSVIISDTPVGSPIVSNPNILIAMNLPSFDKFESSTIPGGKVFINSTLIDRKSQRDDVENFYIPATKLAEDNGLIGLANMVMVGKIIRETGICGMDLVQKAMKKTVSERKVDLFEANLKAVDLGYNFT